MKTPGGVKTMMTMEVSTMLSLQKLFSSEVRSALPLELNMANLVPYRAFTNSLVCVLNLHFSSFSQGGNH